MAHPWWAPEFLWKDSSKRPIEFVVERALIEITSPRSISSTSRIDYKVLSFSFPTLGKESILMLP